MVRAMGLLLVLLASATIALGSPVCCLVGTGCCGAKEQVAEAPVTEHDGCCSHADRPAPAPKAPAEQKPCVCKHDVSTHTLSAEHAPLVALSDVPAVALPARGATGVAPAAHREAPPAPALPTHPLLL
jgi:hypothetical protein